MTSATLDAPPRTTDSTTGPTVTLTIARQALKTALARLAAVVGTGAKALLVTQHVKCEVGPGSLTLTATDADFSSFVRLTVSCEASGEIVALLPARRLAEIVTNLPPVGAVSLALSGTHAVLTAGRAVFELAGMDPIELPEPPSVSDAAPLSVDAAAFLDALDRTVPHTSDAPSRPAFNAVLLEPTSGGCDVVACDSQTLARVRLAADGTLRGSCLVSRLTVPVLARLFGGLPAGARLTVAIDTDAARMVIASADASATVRLVDLLYPAYAVLIERHAPTRVVTCDRLLLRAAIQRVALVTDVARRVEIDLADEITVRAVDPKGGAGADVVPIEVQDPTDWRPTPRTFALNASAVLAALDTLAAQTVAISFESPTRSVLFRPDPATPDQPLVLTQPLRVL